MKIAFRIECPYCKWGHEWRDSYVNQGWIKLQCNHCENVFYTKIYIPIVNVDVEKEMPED